MPPNLEAKSGDLGVDFPFTRAEAAEVDKKLLEFLKVLDVVGLP